MDKYRILFVLSLTISGLAGQVIISRIRGPAVIQDVTSVVGKGTSVVNVINDNEEGTDDFLHSKDSKGSSIVGDSSAVKNFNNYWSIFSQNDDDYGYKKYEIDRKEEGSEANYKLLNGPLVIQGMGPKGISIQSVQNGGAQRSWVSIANLGNGDQQRNYHPAENAAVNVGPAGISIQTTKNIGHLKSAVFTTNVHDHNGRQYNNPAKEETINVGPDEIYIKKMQNLGDRRSPVSITNEPQNYNPTKGQTINVSPAGIYIQKVQDGAARRSSISITNGGQIYNPTKGQTINVGPAGISIQNV